MKRYLAALLNVAACLAMATCDRTYSVFVEDGQGRKAGASVNIKTTNQK